MIGRPRGFGVVVGLLLWGADRARRGGRTESVPGWGTSLFVGAAQALALAQGAVWAGGSDERLPLDAAIVFAPAGGLVVDALRFDLAAELHKRLGEGTLEAYVAGVPSEKRLRSPA